MRVTKADMCSALTEAGVFFEPSATIQQLRPLYNCLKTIQRPKMMLMKTMTTWMTTMISITGNQDNIDEQLLLAEKKRKLRKMQKETMEMEQEIAKMVALTAAAEARVATAATLAAEGPAIVAPTDAVSAANGPAIVALTDAVSDANGLALVAAPVAAAAVATAASFNRRIGFSDIEHAIIDFTGDDRSFDVRDFITNFEDVVHMVDADDSFKLLALRRKLKGAAGCLTRTPEAVSYDGLKTLLIEEFGDALTLVEAERMLRERKWKRTGIHASISAGNEEFTSAYGNYEIY